MKAFPFFIVLVLILIYPLSATDRDIALVYQTKIWDLMDHDKNLARDLLETAQTYDKNLSGLWFARGVLLEEENSLIPAEHAYGKAMEGNDWEGADFDLFLDRYFVLLSRLGLWEKILEMREALGFYRVNNRQVLLSSGWADFFLGKESIAAEKASRGINLYPEDFHFYTLLLACGDDKIVLDSFLYYWGGNEKDLHSAVYTLYKLKRLPAALEEYYKGNAHDDLSRFLVLKKTLEIKPDSLDSLTAYLNDQREFDLDLLWEIFTLTNGEGKKIIDRFLLNFSGLYYTDYDGDFHKELILDKTGGLYVDRNRDGRFETRLELTDRGLPRFWFSETGEGTEREISFYSWPQIREVRRRTPRGEQHFQFLYPRFNLDRESLSSFLYDRGEFSPMVMIKNLEERDLSIPREVFLNHCYVMQEYKGETLFRSYLFHEGEILGIEEDSQEDGILDRQILMSEGKIEAARRDLDGDGSYDLFEYYEKGIWKGYAINLNGKAWSDFYHDWSVIPIKIWDFDKDHIINGYTLESGEEKIIVPQLKNVIEVDDLVYWEKKFEAQWYR